MEKETFATLHDAARVGDVARLEELLEAGKARGKKIVDVVDNNGMTAIYTAAARGHVAVVEALHAAGAAHTLHDVCLAGDVDRVKALLDKGADVNAKYRGLTPLICASLHGRRGVIALLEANGADAAAKGPGGYARQGMTADDYERLATHHLLLEPPWGETESFSVGKEGAVGRAAVPEVKQPKRGGVAAYQQELMSR